MIPTSNARRSPQIVVHTYIHTQTQTSYYMHSHTHTSYLRRGIARNVPHIQRQTVTPDSGTHIYTHTNTNELLHALTHTHTRPTCAEG